ncbi:hypothetical protein MIR68_008408 [Amoeboaphelidium protococcarum]|nr:hypothetical protein MIR68_008408 [Amoeboaphelidium protococcarum]
MTQTMLQQYMNQCYNFLMLQPSNVTQGEYNTAISTVEEQLRRGDFKAQYPRLWLGMNFVRFLDLVLCKSWQSGCASTDDGETPVDHRLPHEKQQGASADFCGSALAVASQLFRKHLMTVKDGQQVKSDILFLMQLQAQIVVEQLRQQSTSDPDFDDDLLQTLVERHLTVSHMANDNDVYTLNVDVAYMDQFDECATEIANLFDADQIQKVYPWDRFLAILKKFIAQSSTISPLILQRFAGDLKDVVSVVQDEEEHSGETLLHQYSRSASFRKKGKLPVQHSFLSSSILNSDILRQHDQFGTPHKDSSSLSPSPVHKSPVLPAKEVRYVFKKSDNADDDDDAKSDDSRYVDAEILVEMMPSEQLIKCLHPNILDYIKKLNPNIDLSVLLEKDQDGDNEYVAADMITRAYNAEDEDAWDNPTGHSRKRPREEYANQFNAASGNTNADGQPLPAHRSSRPYSHVYPCDSAQSPPRNQNAGPSGSQQQQRSRTQDNQQWQQDNHRWNGEIYDEPYPIHHSARSPRHAYPSNDARFPYFNQNAGSQNQRPQNQGSSQQHRFDDDDRNNNNNNDNNNNNNGGRTRNRVMWQFREVELLKQGLERFGWGQWAQILQHFGHDEETGFLPCRTSVDLKDKARNEKKRLLKHRLPLGVFERQ